MTSYFTNVGALIYMDESNTIERAKSVLEERELCVAIIDDGENLKCIKRGEYKETFILYNGHAYMI